MSDQKQIIRNYVLDTNSQDYTQPKLLGMNVMFSETFDDYSITNTSMTTLSDGKVLLVVIFSKDEHTS